MYIMSLSLNMRVIFLKLVPKSAAQAANLPQPVLKLNSLIICQNGLDLLIRPKLVSRVVSEVVLLVAEGVLEKGCAADLLGVFQVQIWRVDHGVFRVVLFYGPHLAQLCAEPWPVGQVILWVPWVGEHWNLN